ncbi:MAG: helix-turn-helix domain-containing protein, partial [Pseudomonadota bacterium]
LPLEVLKDPARFRTDLFYRLNTVEIHLPPLRERREDIGELVAHYLSHYERRYARPRRILDAEVLAQLTAHDWPGNVRALRHAVERAVILAEAETSHYRIEDFALPAAGSPAAGLAVGQHTVPGVQAAANTATHRATNPVAPASTSREGATPVMTLEEVERQAVASALHKHGFNISRAARELGLTRAALYRRMEKHDL